MLRDFLLSVNQGITDIIFKALRVMIVPLFFSVSVSLSVYCSQAAEEGKEVHANFSFLFTYL